MTNKILEIEKLYSEDILGEPHQLPAYKALVVQWLGRGSYIHDIKVQVFAGVPLINKEEIRKV